MSVLKTIYPGDPGFLNAVNTSDCTEPLDFNDYPDLDIEAMNELFPGWDEEFTDEIH